MSVIISLFFIVLLCTILNVDCRRRAFIRNSNSNENNKKKTINVSGVSEIFVAPDICYITLIKESKSFSAETAYTENAKTMRSISTAIQSLEISKKDIQTTNLNLNPQYHYERDSNKRIFDGYIVSQVLSIKVRDLTKPSVILDTAIKAGATEIQSVQFTVENPKVHAVEARTEALKSAKRKAEHICEVTGMKLLKPISIVEDEGNNNIGQPNYFAQSNSKMMHTSLSANSGGEASTLEPGEIKLIHRVNIEYEME